MLNITSVEVIWTKLIFSDVSEILKHRPIILLPLFPSSSSSTRIRRLKPTSSFRSQTDPKSYSLNYFTFLRDHQ
jgi:hypothetical protein